MAHSFAHAARLVPLCVTLFACGSGGGAASNTGGTGGTTGDAATGSAGTGGAGTAPDGPVPATLPTPTGACPEFKSGLAPFTVGGVARQAKLWVDDAAAAAHDGPLVFYWYGTAGTPEQADTNVSASRNPGLGPDGIARITALGGIVAAPVHVESGTFPWLATVASDEALADEIIGCAKSTIGIDPRHIHSLGFSAGGLFTANFSMDRSAYIASVVTYSGGGGPTTAADPSNKFAAMIVFGGDNDQLVLNFRDQSNAYRSHLTDHFTFMCNHGGGHMIAPDIQGSAVQFFLDHPFGQDPSPYAGGLPASFPAYCTL